MAKNDAIIRYIDNLTILCNVDESVSLPHSIVAQMDDYSYKIVTVEWENKPIITNEDGMELIYEGEVEGYFKKVLCSIQVGYQTDNPQSAYPWCIDNFGLQKRDIQTEDIPAIDDYQYFKAKIPRTLVEEYHLKQLREKVADQVILARDINHLRNAVIQLEKYGWILQDQLDELFDRVEDLEDRVDWIEENMVIDGDNVGSGAGVFDRKRKRVLEFKTLVGDGLEIEEGDDELKLIVSDQEESGKGKCGVNTLAKTFTTCNGTEENHFPTKMWDGMFSFSDYFNMQMVKINNYNSASSQPYYHSLLWVLGSGTKNPIAGNSNFGSDGTESSLFAGRILKSVEKLIFEIKTDNGKYSGFEVGNKAVGIYNNESESKIQAEIYQNEIDVYSQDVSAKNRYGRYGLTHGDTPNESENGEED